MHLLHISHKIYVPDHTPLMKVPTLQFSSYKQKCYTSIEQLLYLNALRNLINSNCIIVNIKVSQTVSYTFYRNTRLY